ncbi:SprT family zinc-dependent metalloprotease [Vineibacter terrae]|uniref:M48 family metallopeptidase n=1 Tax=Vineibacter terrae TaxID=2586908 RepID=UPI002E3578E8|nr:SprT family zinc-dependent metalloprotease [Vineibacter terrae]HEX2887530.1 SprT family zinc-dependent metalloprotease [Vineibacter terrae]
MSSRRIDPLTIQPPADLFGNGPSPSAKDPQWLTFTEGGRRLEVQFQRSARARCIGMYVDPTAKTVTVVAPVLEPMAAVERFVRRKLAWALAAREGLATSRATDAVDIAHAGETLTVAYEPSARARRVALRVDARTGHVKLVVPPRMSREQALEFAQQNAAWIATRLKRRQPPVPFADGAVIPLFDAPHRIRHRPDARGTVWIENGEIHVAGGVEHMSRRVGDWLTARLREHLQPLVREKAARVERPASPFSLRDTATQWGSCSKSGALCFSLRLAFAPSDVVDYVVAHEIAHLVHHNHSARFWALAAKLTAGDLAACKAWLRHHGQSVMRYG